MFQLRTQQYVISYYYRTLVICNLNKCQRVYLLKIYLEWCIVSLGESSDSPLVLCNLQPTENFQEMSRHRKWWSDPIFMCSLLLIWPSVDWSSSDARNILQAMASVIALLWVLCTAALMSAKIPRVLMQTADGGNGKQSRNLTAWETLCGTVNRIMYPG